MTNADQIASKLTEAQRRTMLWRQSSEPIMVWNYARTMNVLDRLGLLKDRSGGWGTLTPLGLEVRRILESQTNDKR